MGFRTTSVRKWEREWRLSDWRETIPLFLGRECPDCLATICGGKSWRAHAMKEQRDAELREAELKARAEWEEWAVRTIYELCERAGITLESHPSGTDFDLDGDAKPQVTDGYVIGSGPLPDGLRGGDEQIDRKAKTGGAE